MKLGKQNFSDGDMKFDFIKISFRSDLDNL